MEMGYFNYIETLENQKFDLYGYMRIARSENTNIEMCISENKSMIIEKRDLPSRFDELKFKKIILYPLKYEKEIFGLLMIEIKEITAHDEETLVSICECIILHLEKNRIEEERINTKQENEYRCLKCGTKLLEYKGSIDCVEIKCRKCGEIVKIKK